MAKYELLLPKMGESVAEATVTSWIKNVGDAIESEDSVIEIATDKVDSEVPSPVSGVLIKKLVQEGEIAKIGFPVAIIETEEAIEEVKNEPQKIASEPATINTPSITKEVSSLPSEGNRTKSNNFAENKERFYSPLVKSIALKENISPEELSQIHGTGKASRVTKSDILNYLNRKENSPDNISSSIESPLTHEETAIPSSKSLTGEEDIIEMDRMRKLIADNMLRSKQISPHVTSAIEIDVTNLVKWRIRVKNEFESREKEKLTFTPIFVEAVAKALKDFPLVNVSVNGDTIVVKKNINIGMAVALPSGNLIVPVVHNADQLNIIGLAKRINDLTTRARLNKLKMEDIEGGTFTLTNIGTFGNAIGTPIINQPQVAILSTGVIKKKPAVIETPEGDAIAIRQMMFLSMSYDHRVVDGMLGGSFLRRVADYLENFDINRQIW